MGFRLPVSFVVCALNEEKRIEGRVAELLHLLDRGGIEGEVVVVSDGSTDDTVLRAGKSGDPRVHVLDLPERVGKAEALSRGAAEAKHEILAFADVRQTWADDALSRLLNNFADPEVGAVSGDLVLTSGSGSIAGVGLYWRYEKWLRRKESQIASQVGVTGAICACRRELFRPIPRGTLLDDVYWPMRVVLQGRRVVHDSRSLAYDRLPSEAHAEFRRKVRTLAGNYQLVALLPELLLPWRNPLWVQLFSHKLARLLVPWALLGLFLSNVFLLREGPLPVLAMAAQILGYAIGLIGLRTDRLGKLGSALASFLVLNAAAGASLWVWLSGGAGSSWKKTTYAPAASTEAKPSPSSVTEN
ncbi:MAG: glycosyltransferase family 2 protein [Gemmataceae bacterium]